MYLLQLILASLELLQPIQAALALPMGGPTALELQPILQSLLLLRPILAALERPVPTLFARRRAPLQLSMLMVTTRPSTTH